jgi:hypothetical protein
VRRFGLRYVGHRPGAPLGNFTGAPFELVPGHEYEVPPDGFVLGRSATAGLRVMSGIVARAHVRVRPAGDGLAVEDLGAVTGTQVNGARVRTAVLQVGDRLALAEAFDFEVTELEGAGADGA